jgi:hypothetical protein
MGEIEKISPIAQAPVYKAFQGVTGEMRDFL